MCLTNQCEFSSKQDSGWTGYNPHKKKITKKKRKKKISFPVYPVIVSTAIRFWRFFWRQMQVANDATVAAILMQARRGREVKISRLK